MNNSERLTEILKKGWPELAESQIRAVIDFYERLLAENEVQNLTRLTGPEDFWGGHVRDVQELLKSGLLAFPAMDLGSGCGVPGLLAATVAPGEWILCDSEANKARFLEKTVRELGLGDRVSVFSGRGEEFLKTNSVACVVSRAVGPVGRIYAWLENCSTWNKLLLFKGPGWTKEWEEFRSGRGKNRLKIEKKYSYTVGAENKARVLVLLEHVPRGTSAKTDSHPNVPRGTRQVFLKKR